MFRKNNDGTKSFGCGFYIVFYIINIVIFLGLAIYIVAKVRSGG